MTIESSHFQWSKLSMNIGMVVVLFVVTLLRGDGNKPSIVGVSRCDPYEWALLATLVIVALILTVGTAIMLNREYHHKCDIDYKFVKGDFQCTIKNAIKLPLIALGGGFLAASLGIGAGLIFNPVLIQMDVNPTVASGTGQYMTMYTTLSSTIVGLLMGKLNHKYAIVVNVLTIIGSYPGIYAQTAIVKKAGGKQQYVVMILCAFIIMILVSIPTLSTIAMTHKHEEGLRLFAFNSYC